MERVRSGRGLLASGLGVLLAAVIAVGCGGDDDGDGGGEPLTKSEFITQADAICSDASAELDTKAEEIFGSAEPSEEEINEFVKDEVLPNLRDQADELDELSAPEGDEEQVDAIVSNLRDGVDELEDDPAAIISGEGGESLNEATRLASEYGLEECGA